MSADNGIYILITTDRQKRQDGFLDPVEGGIKAYRVAEVRWIDDIYYLRNEERHNLGAFMYEYWEEGSCFLRGV